LNRINDFSNLKERIVKWILDGYPQGIGSYLRS